MKGTIAALALIWARSKDVHKPREARFALSAGPWRAGMSLGAQHRTTGHPRFISSSSHGQSEGKHIRIHFIYNRVSHGQCKTCSTYVCERRSRQRAGLRHSSEARVKLRNERKWKLSVVAIVIQILCVSPGHQTRSRSRLAPRRKCDSGRRL